MYRMLAGERCPPSVWNEDVKKVVRLIYTVYEHDPVGNPLHVVLDDWNLEDEFIEVYEPAVDGLPKECVDAARELVPLLLSMSLDERLSALAYAHGYVALPEVVIVPQDLD